MKLNPVCGRSVTFIVTFLSIYVSLSSAQDINFYDDETNVFTLTITGGCYNFKPKWDKRATAIEVVDNGCYHVWDRFGCTGAKLRVQGGVRGIKNLRDVNFAKTIRSANICSPEESEATAGRRGEMFEVRDSESSRFKVVVDKSSLQEVRYAAVDEHNKYRQKHGVPLLRGDDDLHDEAQKWAEHLAETHRFEPSRTFKFGENLATSFRRNKVDAVRDAISRWYNKIKNYDYDRPGYNVDGMPSGSFTAVVWKSTTKMGIGIAWDEQEEAYIVVAFYEPQGLQSSNRNHNRLELVEVNSGRTCHLRLSEHLSSILAAFILLGIFNRFACNPRFQVPLLT